MTDKKRMAPRVLEYKLTFIVAVFFFAAAARVVFLM